MTKDAYIVLTSYDSKKITSTISRIRELCANLGMSINEVSHQQKIDLLKKQSKIWGCEGTNVKNEIFMISGSIEHLTQLSRIATEDDGIYIRLLLAEVA